MERIVQYADAVFSFCLRRTGSIEDARDLSQDILCEALASLQNGKVERFEGWLWAIARNCYCRYIRQQKQRPLLMEANLLAGLAEEPQEPDADHQAIFQAVHSLAASHRDILVDFYVYALSCEQIARRHGLRPETVRSRLFYGREKLWKRWQTQMNEQHIYSPQNWYLSGNGDVDTSLLKRQAVRAILTACYDGLISTEDISLATGIPCLYIEDELPALLSADVLECQKGKYRTRMIIHRNGFPQSATQLLLEGAASLAEPLLQTLEACMPRIRQLGFHGCDLPQSRLWWSLIPRLMREACEQTRAQNPEMARCAFPVHPDGSRGWLCAYESAEGVHRFFSGCNAYYLAGSHFRYYWSNQLFSPELNQLLRHLEAVDLTSARLQDCIHDEALLARCIRCDVAVKTENGFEWNIPVFTRKELDQLQYLLKGASQNLIPCLSPLANRLLRIMKAEIPVHLHDQIKGIFGVEFNALIDMLCRQLQERGVLETPANDIFAGQVMMVLQDRQYPQAARTYGRF